MSLVQSLKNVVTSQRVLSFVIFFSAVFFALFKLTSIPPGTQNDVIRSSLTAEQFLNNLDGDGTSLRQIIAYFLNGGYWTYLIGDIFRSTFNIEALTIISRLPAAIFFVSTAMVWLNILLVLNFPKKGMVLFFLIFLPSAAFITYSHHIPLVAGYFFFTSCAVYYFLRFMTAFERSFVYLGISLVCAALATYTHGISIFFGLLFYPLFIGTTMLIYPQLIREKFAYLKAYGQGTFVQLSGIIILFLLLMFPFFQGFLGSDRSLQMRDATTIKYLVENGETDIAVKKALPKIWSYVHPNTLVWSGDIVKGEQPIYSPEFFDVKNARYNQWVTTNLSPFGFIGGVALIIIPFILLGSVLKVFPDEFKVPIILTLTLALVYILLPIFPNYDNPSVAKSLPALMFIPLSISVMVQYLSHRERFVHFWLIFLTAAGMNTFYNLTYLYSERYQSGETQKYYQYNTQKLASDIATDRPLANTRIYLSLDNGDIQNAISYYLSPYILNRMVYGKLDINSINENEHTLVITNNQEDVNALESQGTFVRKYVYWKPDKQLDFYMIELRGSEVSKDSQARLINPSDALCRNELYHPFFTGETEYLIHQYRYFDTASSSYILEKCPPSFPLTFQLLNTVAFSGSGNTLLTSPAPDVWRTIPALTGSEAGKEVSSLVKRSSTKSDVTYIFSDTKDVTSEVEYHSIEPSVFNGTSLSLTATRYPGKASVDITGSQTGQGTYLVKFDYQKDKFSYLDVYVVDMSKGLNVPASLLRQDYDPSGKQTYQTLLYVEENRMYGIGIDLHNRHLNIDKDKHLVKADISNISVVKLTSDNLFSLMTKTEPEGGGTIADPAVNQISPEVVHLLPGIVKISGVANTLAMNENSPDASGVTTDSILALNQPYSNFNLAISPSLEFNQPLVNGITQGIVLPEKNMTSENETDSNFLNEETMYVINLGWILGGIFFIAFVGIQNYFITYDQILIAPRYARDEDYDPREVVVRSYR